MASPSPIACLKHGLKELEGGLVAAHHDAGAVAGASLAARGARVEEAHPGLLCHLRAAKAVLIHRVAGVNKNVAGLEELKRLGKARLGGSSAGNHYPQHARCRQRAHKLRHARHRRNALPRGFLTRLGAGIKANSLVTVVHKIEGNVGAHLS